MNAESGKRKKGLSILGSTGSIGTSTLDVVRRHPERFEVVSLSAGDNTALLKEQAIEFRPRFVSTLTGAAATELKRDLPAGTCVGSGEQGASEAATFEGVDMVVSAISGAAGLVPTLAAIRAGRDIALANKETLVMAGAIVMDEVRKHGVRLLPVDSEHSALFQAMLGHRADDIKRIILTASGGPFLKTTPAELERVTPEAALRHPSWSMGRKITIDSATLMNKGLEVIEARWLFDQGPDRISVIIHPQSIVHSMVEYIDGSVVAQLGSPDMKVPIAYALAYPERISSGAADLELAGKSLEFMEPDMERFPCLALAYRALDAGGVLPAVVNAADEVAVDMFLKGELGFTDIYRVIERVVDRSHLLGGTTIEEVLEADRWARAETKSVTKKMA